MQPPLMPWCCWKQMAAPRWAVAALRGDVVAAAGPAEAMQQPAAASRAAEAALRHRSTVAGLQHCIAGLPWQVNNGSLMPQSEAAARSDASSSASKRAVLNHPSTFQLQVDFSSVVLQVDASHYSDQASTSNG